MVVDTLEKRLEMEIDLQKMPLLAQKIIVSNEAHFDLVTSTSQRQLMLIKANIRDIQLLHTINNVLNNWTNRVGYCMASRGSHMNKIIFHY